jgi:ribosomal protein S4
MIFSSKDSVRRGLEKFGIEIREKSKHHGNPSQPKYGQRKIQKGLIEHKTEKRTIDTIAQMREEGLSLRAIARFLNQMKVPTKKRGESWHPEMVRRLCFS